MGKTCPYLSSCPPPVGGSGVRAEGGGVGREERQSSEGALDVVRLHLPLSIASISVSHGMELKRLRDTRASV